MEDPTNTVQLNPIDRAAGRFEVVVYKAGTGGDVAAYFECNSEGDALRLRTAIRDCAEQLRRVHDYRAAARTP